MKWELPPPLPANDLNRGVRNKESPQGVGAGKKTQKIPELADDSFVKPKPPANGGKLDEKSIFLIQEFVAGLFQVKRYEDALHLSLLIVERVSDYADAYYNGALALFHLQRYHEARNLMKRAPESMWEQGNPNYNMTCIEVALGNHSSAIEYAKNAATLDSALLKEMQKDPDLRAIHKELKAIK